MAFTNTTCRLSKRDIMRSIAKHKSKVKEVIKLSKDKDYQKKLFPFIVNPLPLATSDPTRWQTFHFTDLMSDSKLNNLAGSIANSVSGDAQKRTLTSIIQSKSTKRPKCLF